MRKRHHHPHFPGRKGDFLADKSYTHAPNLKRCAVVSAPERDIAGEPIAARLNKNVGDALAAAKEEAAKDGWIHRMIASSRTRDGLMRGERACACVVGKRRMDFHGS